MGHFDLPRTLEEVTGPEKVSPEIMVQSYPLGCSVDMASSERAKKASAQNSYFMSMDSAPPNLMRNVSKNCWQGGLESNCLAYTGEAKNLCRGDGPMIEHMPPVELKAEVDTTKGCFMNDQALLGLPTLGHPYSFEAWVQTESVLPPATASDRKQMLFSYGEHDKVDRTLQIYIEAPTMYEMDCSFYGGGYVLRRGQLKFYGALDGGHPLVLTSLYTSSRQEWLLQTSPIHSVSTHEVRL